ncbi:MAG: hypothetical protein WBN23_06075 [Woeseia sp.]
MSTTSASAPGKIVLCGEYAVLHGAPAIAAAVSRRARVDVEATARAGVRVRAPGYRDDEISYRLLPGGALEQDAPVAPDRDFALFEQLWKACAPAVTGGLEIRLDTAAFSDPATRRKLGLGSSAALSVALVAALRPELDANAVAALAGKAHRDFQQGGSGVDIACAVYGGVIRYRQGGGTPDCVALPQDLHLAILWSGTPASTASRIQALDSSLRRPGRHATLQALMQQADALAAGWQSGDAGQVYRLFTEYVVALRAFDADQKLGIFAAGHAALADAAVERGLVYKPCGAGGGDVGVAIALDAGVLEGFVAHAAQAGFSRPGVDLGAVGLQRDGKQHDD